MDKGYYKKSQYIHLWIHLLLKANHEDTNFIWNKKDCILHRGQLLTGRKKLSDETGITQSTIENILKTLENEHQIKQQKYNLFRVITITNYDAMQKLDSKFDNKVTTKEQQSNNKVTHTINVSNENECNELKDSVRFDIARCFENFWSIYPRKIGKAAALRKFTKLVTSEKMAGTIIEAVRNQRRLNMLNPREKYRFCPHPATWLNQGRWEDTIQEPEPIPKQSEYPVDDVC